jgi:hypothetical protein
LVLTAERELAEEQGRCAGVIANPVLYPRRAEDSLLASETAESLLAAVEPELFASFSRVDQRKHGADYMRGLLRTEGRKTPGNMALVLGDPVNGQQLHHFVSSSTWKWALVRRSLGRLLLRRAPVEAWVVRPILMTKYGEKSVGVCKVSSPSTHRLVNAQHAFGVWAVGDSIASPISWRLRLTEEWLTDDRRDQAGIPVGLSAESSGVCAIQACVKLRDWLKLPYRPVVLDLAGEDVADAVAAGCESKMPLVARVPYDLPLVLGEAAVRGSGRSLVQSACRLAQLPRAGGGRGLSGQPLVGPALSVRLPHRRHCADLTLFAVQPREPGLPISLWLTNLTHLEPTMMARLSATTEQVNRALPGVRHAGLNDYAGRSFGGWHRHVTLVSAAHVLKTLSER